MMISVRILSPLEWPVFGRHLKSLGSDDRRMRFGSTVSDGAIEAHISRLRPLVDTVTAAFSHEAEMMGAALITRDSGDAVEISVSVLPHWRGRGIGTILVKRSMLWARNRGYRHAAVRFLSENAPMSRLAHRCGMRVVKDLGDAEGRLELPAPTWLSHAVEWSEECAAVARYALVAAGNAARWYAPGLGIPAATSAVAAFLPPAPGTR